MANPNTVFELTRAQLNVVFHALCLAEAYYADPDRKVKGMHPPTEAVIASRLAGINPLVELITRHAKELL